MGGWKEARRKEPPLGRSPPAAGAPTSPGLGEAVGLEQTRGESYHQMG